MQTLTEPKIIAGNSNMSLASAITRRMSMHRGKLLEVVDARIERFNDQEIFIEVYENVRGEDMFIVQSTSNPANDNLMELLIMADALTRELAKRINAPLSIVDKRRERPGEVADMTVIGDVSNKKCIIVDDICDTAGTLCKAAEVLIDNGASEVHSYITHGVLSGPAVERITNSVMKSLVISDSIEATKAVKDAKNIRIVPSAPMFAQAILNIWSGTSVSSLFETDTLEPIYDGLFKFTD
ncbi:MAG: ribose-phosphate diphosphokinase [Rhodobacteraceae bacterium]|nr:ribose-phosphate diphosphokinase [Paracoccaceae bacterium]